MDEIWKDIEDYEGYQVSSEGRVRSLDRVVEYSNGVKHRYFGQIMKPKEEIKGYLRIGLRKDGKATLFAVHRLVAKAFIPNPDDLPEVNHKNEVKTDNRAVNLEWCSGEYNLSYGTRNQRIADKQSKPVYQYTLDNQLVKVWASSNECGRNGFSQGHIASCCRNCYGRNTHKGYKWSYEPL